MAFSIFVFLAVTIIQLLGDEGFVFSQRGSAPAQQLLGLLILLFCFVGIAGL